ncbi:MAG: DNA replication/repair protein RecF [Chitinophagaceae bacterium]|nr:DNA replication/repair protein RecF [Chitinophagaceae bacterium]MCW5905634.1 DNA replication/repair protein RecF [Chitinophagaceae bacterium]
MLRLNNISFVQFKNYLQHQFVFDQKVIGICGNNGTGKTNLLDAIYYLSFTKSYFTGTDAQNVFHGKAGMRIEGNYTNDTENCQLVCILRENNKKEFLQNNETLKKFSDHIGRYPCVMIAPDDTELLVGSSELRRKYIDTIIAQINKQYLQYLIDYGKLLQQRNSLLKQAAETTILNEDVLNILDKQLSEKATYIYHTRKDFFNHYLQLTLEYYTKIAENTDNISLAYQSSLHHDTMQELLKNALQKDIVLQRTSVGTHKDDIDITMNQFAFKTTASQGQRKSLLFALKLAEWQTLKLNKGFAPILLLDDVFEKLDQQRMYNLLQWVCKEDDGQVFITDTHKSRLQQALQHADITFQLIELS